MSFVFPNPSASDKARRGSHGAFETGTHPASGGAGLSSAGGMVGSADSSRRGASAAAANKTRRKGKGKGRMMMIKIFYSLASPRFGSTHSNSATPASSAPTPDFLAVLDPSLAPSPHSSSTQAPSNAPQEPHYSCMARLSAPVWVQVLNSKKSADGRDDRQQFGRVTLKTCLSAICISRPELVIDASKDFSVSAVDPYETSHSRQPPAGAGFASSSSTSGSDGARGLVEGKGMLSWTLAEKKEGTTMVCGKIAGSEEGDARRNKRRRADDGSVIGGENEDSDSGDEIEETLEVWLQLTERDAFTQVQFLDCLRSYHNPVQQLQSEMSDFNSSPPKQRDPAPFMTSSSSHARSSGVGGDPIKRKRPRDSPVLPIPAVAAVAPPAPFSAPPPSATAPPADALAQDPRVLALLSQLVPSLGVNGSTSAAAPSLDTPQGQALLPAIRTLAQFYGLELPAPIAAAAEPVPSSMPPSSTAGPLPQPSARPPTTLPAATAKGSRKKEREHFATIDPSTLTIPPQGKQNPRDPASGCSNCKRRKSTVWREGFGPDGKLTSVCNACGTFYNKNGYHRSKGGADPSSSAAPQASTSAAAPKAGRPLQGRLTATCEADLEKHKTKRKPSSPSDKRRQAGIIPPLSPSKHIGPRSPSLSFGFASTSKSGARPHATMSSPGRSPRLRYRQTSNPFAATSPIRGSSTNAGLGVSYDSDADERGSNPFAFLGNGSPSPARVHTRPPSGGKAMPSYLLTASPGTALDRILNDTNVGLFGPMAGGASAGQDAMNVEQHGAAGAPADGGFADFSFFLQPGSPTLNKENTRPSLRGAAGEQSTLTTDPSTDFDNVLSSLRRDFSARLSSNALTAPSSPAASSPCLLPRTSAASPGSKGKAPESSGRAPPSILDSFIDNLVPAFSLDGSAAGIQLPGTTPASESDAWSPADGGNDATLTLDSALLGTSRSARNASHHGATSSFDLNSLKPSESNRRGPFIPSHVLHSDANPFDMGSLPPSSPPPLPSEVFPTPSDFDGITPSADGGDGEDRPGTAGGEVFSPLTIEAVAEKVVNEPNEEARRAMLALLQSLGGQSPAKGEAVQLAGPTGDKFQLDRSTVNKLLSLISTSGNAASPSALASTLTASTSTATITEAKADDLADYASFDLFKSLEPTASGAPELQGQVSDLYRDLFSDAPF
ncbi:hypothetical protein JCM10207_002284 [Rhodosporidiobolus poonsookiae]